MQAVLFLPSPFEEGVLMPNGCQRQTYTMTSVTVQGVHIPMYTPPDRSVPPSDRQRQIIVSTLGLIPSVHLRRVFGRRADSSHVQVSKSSCSPSEGGGNGAFLGQNWVRLSADCMGQSYNQRLNATLLHEFGHLVDHAYGAMHWLRRNDRQAYGLLRNTRHEGGTQTAGETFADCYMIYVYSKIAGLGYTHRADPDAYRGEEAQRRFRALLSTPPFDQLPLRP